MRRNRSAVKWWKSPEP